MEHKIVSVLPGSVGEEVGIEKGDVLVSVNGEPVEDVFDFRDVTGEECFTLFIRKENGEEWELEIEKDWDEELGLVFENDLMSDYKGCTNKCIFCFIDQMPPGMRDTLYFKDDDSRLSFLQGNYITLTNMSDHDVERMIHYRMEPMNISVHTTNPALRVKMLNNRFAGEKLAYLDRFYEEKLQMNGQIVLCKGWNDGEELERTLTDLYRYLPVLQSLSVVPVGLTKYRDNLPSLELFTKEDAEKVIETIEKWQKKAFSDFGFHYVHASDEFYILAEREFPEEERYDGYLQLENGVGMARSLLSDGVREAESLKKTFRPKKSDYRKLTFATGRLAAPILERLKKEVAAMGLPLAESEIVPIRNDFFGENVTVAGLLTGQDIIARLKEKKLGDVVVLPNCMFRSGETVFLDDVTREDAERELGVPVVILRDDADAFVHALLGRITPREMDLTHGEYELKK